MPTRTLLSACKLNCWLNCLKHCCLRAPIWKRACKSGADETCNTGSSCSHASISQRYSACHSDSMFDFAKQNLSCLCMMMLGRSMWVNFSPGSLRRVHGSICSWPSSPSTPPSNLPNSETLLMYVKRTASADMQHAVVRLHARAPVADDASYSVQTSADSDAHARHHKRWRAAGMERYATRHITLRRHDLHGRMVHRALHFGHRGVCARMRVCVHACPPLTHTHRQFLRNYLNG